MDYKELHVRKDYDDVQKLARYNHGREIFVDKLNDEQLLLQILGLDKKQLAILQGRYETDKDFETAVDLCEKKY